MKPSFWRNNMYKIGDITEGTIVRVYPRYAIILFEDGETGLLHISEVSKKFIMNLAASVPVGSIHKVKIMEIDEKNHSIRVSKKKVGDGYARHYYKKKKVPPSEVDCSALRDNLAKWVEENISSSHE